LLWVHFLYLNQWLHQLQCSALKLRIPISMKGQQCGSIGCLSSDRRDARPAHRLRDCIEPLGVLCVNSEYFVHVNLLRASYLLVSQLHGY